MSDADAQADTGLAPRTIAIGDIHGCAAMLRALLAELALRPHDTLVVLGDAINRGPDSRGVLQQLLEVSLRCRLVYIAGNHEEVMLAALFGQAGGMPNFREMGGRATLESYNGSLDNMPAEHHELVAAACEYWETEHEIFVHANLQPGVELNRQSAEWLRWMHLRGSPPPFAPGKRVIYGHTPQRSGLPNVIPGWVGIDTWAFHDGWLTSLDVGRDWVVQVNNAGTVRKFTLNEMPQASG